MRIFIVRHGVNDFDCHDSHGRQQLEACANFLKGMGGVEPNNTILLSSPLERAVRSSTVILKILQLGSVTDVGWLDCDEGGIFQGTMRFVRDNPEVTNLILVGHHPDIEKALYDFADFVGKRRPDGRVGNGSVFLVDTETKEIKKLFSP